ncbi:MAG: SGNH/GDSL hydrolase family protein, partial [Verrucomicrobiota bacterium]
TLLLAGLLLASSLWAQRGPQTDPFLHPHANPVDDPSLPRVLIIGDSISIGYTPGVRRHLKGIANVHRPRTNCRWAAYGDEMILEWLGDSEWDAIHFNFGLWDWYGWRQEEKATPESYAKSLESIVAKMRGKTNAKLVFGITTPPCVGPEVKVQLVISEEEAKAFNQAAREVMDAAGVKVNDLYGVVRKERERLQLGEDNVHYTEEGYELLARRVAAQIKGQLDGENPMEVSPR